ncbi:S-layer homology domain-containing protein [Paenibacillus sp. M1]|uniref:S-layer homology domain-containing protein n=1 Tax=Paenibacillus haidiansis TaxID=1574488 RepID=A0ABU7VLK1_9BACL
MKSIRTALALLILLSAAVLQPKLPVFGKELPFTDIDQSFAKESIIRLYEQRIMNGTSESLFSPSKPITRPEFLVTINRLLGLEPVASPVPAYIDVGSRAWYYAQVQASTELGLTEGKGGGSFAPSQPVTRQEAAVWIIRILAENAEGTNNAGIRTGYRDDAAIAAWARPSVAAMKSLGLMEGSDGRFYPAQSLTRAEIAVILDRLLQSEELASKLAAEAEPSIQIGWQYDQTDAEYKASILKSNINVLSPRWFFLNQDGGITDYSVPSLSAWTRQNGKQVWAMFGNRLNMENTHALLSSPGKTSSAITTVVTSAAASGIQGINLDFENIGGADREAFTSFVAELSRQLHAKGMVLSVDVSPDLGTDWTEAFDYAALGKSADYIVLMGYDEHWSGGAAGSVSSLAWVENGLKTLLSKVSSSKIILGMPLYTRDWTVNSKGATAASEDLTLAAQIQQVRQLGLKPKWNGTLGQYTAEYSSAGSIHRIWLEESRSLSRKYGMAMEHGVAGFAYWSIGGEVPEIWPALRNAAKYAAIRAQQ